MSTPRLAGALVSAALGVSSHVFIFAHGEWHLKASPVVKTYALLLGLVYFAVTLANLYELGHGIQALLGSFALRKRPLVLTFQIAITYFLGLYTSLFIHRLFLSPLCSFPGPILFRLTKLTHFVRLLTNSQNHLLLEGLHQKYGTHVRTGPSELTIFHPDAFAVCSGPKTSCIKGAFYDVVHPQVAIVSIRTKEGYAPRRRMWDEAVRDAARTRWDEEVTRRRAGELVNFLSRDEAEKSRKEVELGGLLMRCSYDILGELAFGKNLGLLDNVSGRESKKKRGDLDVVNLINSGMAVLGVLSVVPWLMLALFCIPGAAKGWNAARAWSAKLMLERVEEENEKSRNNKQRESEDQKNDFSAFLIRAATTQREDFNNCINFDSLYGDAFTVVVAGSHTVAATLTFLFYELAKHPDIQTRARAELIQLDSDDAANWKDDTPYLNACIEETLRLHPALPTHGIRMTQDQGMHIAGRWVPPHTTIVAPRYSMGRLESCFVSASSFIPDRWTSRRDELVLDSRAHNPFSIGRHTCPGKALGLMEIRMIAAALLRRFEIAFAPGSSDQAERGTTDCFVAQPGRLNISLKQIDYAGTRAAKASRYRLEHWMD